MFDKIAEWIFGSSSSDDEDDDVDQNISIAKGRLTKALKKLSQTLDRIEHTRATIGANGNFLSGIDLINQTALDNYERILNDGRTLAELNLAALIIDDAISVFSNCAPGDQNLARSIPKKCSRLEPVKATEPEFKIIEEKFRKAISFDDLERSRKKAVKLNRELEIKLKNGMKFTEKLATLKNLDDNNPLHLELTLNCLEFYTLQFLTSNGNLRKNH